MRNPPVKNNCHPVSFSVFSLNEIKLNNEKLRSNPTAATPRIYSITRISFSPTKKKLPTPEQRPFAKKRSDFANADQLTDLLEVVKTVKPTILVGTSTQPGTFTKEVVEAMCENTERPVIFPLSNPTKLAEATAKDLIEWSNGKAFVATGIPSDDIEYNGVNYVIGQANNALIYPGLGLGMLASEASLLTDEMIGAAAHALSGIVDITKPGAPVLPPFKYVAEVSLKVATAVAKKAQEQGLARVAEQDMEKAVRDFRWTPKY